MAGIDPKRKAKMLALIEKIKAAKLQKEMKRKPEDIPPPRYTEIFRAGVQELFDDVYETNLEELGLEFVVECGECGKYKRALREMPVADPFGFCYVCCRKVEEAKWKDMEIEPHAEDCQKWLVDNE